MEMRQLRKEPLGSLQGVYLTDGSGTHHCACMKSMGCSQPVMTANVKD